MVDIENLLLPKLLFGRPREVRLGCWKMVQAAWRSGSWSEATQDVEFVAASTLSKELYVSRPASPLKMRESLWRLYFINDELIRLRGKLDKDVDADRIREFLLDGMDNFWFVLGLLEIGNPHAIVDFRLSESTIEARMDAAAYLRKVVRWLDELTAVGSYLRSADDPGYDITLMWPGWTQSGQVSLRDLVTESVSCDLVLRLARYAGLQLTFWKVKTDYGGNIAHALLREGLVRSAKNGYELLAP